MNQELKIMKPRYSSSVNVNMKSLINAIGHQRIHYNITSGGRPELIDESEIFGSESILHTNSLLLYLYLHFLGPSSDATVLLDVQEASDFLGKTTRTIINNLKLLRKKGYINFEPGLLDGTYDVFLEYYSDNGLKKSQGGSGYIVLDRKVMDKLITFKKINPLRFAIRTLLNNVPGKQNFGMSTGCTMKELRYIFPTYTQRHDVLDILKDKTINELFSIRFGRTMNYLKVRVVDLYDSSAIRLKQLSDTRKKLKELFMSFNLKYPDNNFNPSNEELKNISNITLNYPYSSLKRAIERLYIYRKRSDIKNLPAYLYQTTANLLS